MENYPQLVPLIILIPALGAIINIHVGARLTERWSSLIATTASALSFVIAILLYSYLHASGYQAAIVNPPVLQDWILIESLNINIPWQLRVDTLSVTMMLVITGVGTLIHIYSAGYMHGDPRFSRFFVYLNLFLAFMLILVAGNNFLVLFVGWEGVGLCSWFLIGFWFDKSRGIGWKNANAARKAMIANRVGDFGMLIGIFLTFWTFSTLDFYRPGEIANPHAGEHGAAVEHVEAATVEGETAGEHGDEHGDEHAAGPVYTDNEHIPTEQLGVFGQAERMLALPEGDPGRTVALGPFRADIVAVLGLITFFFLIGVTGKSAQIPLFVWLPDAMAGPTPASALIHAATMVTAGVYLMVRSNVFYAAADLTSLLVTIIGVATALVAGFVALGQWDIKRVLAYSTVSQLGFMVAAVGIGAYGAAMFHLVTHAFFKALLFLGSGSVIHGVEHGHHETHHAAHGDGHAGEADEFDPQDMRNMGGLASRMPVTYITYLIGTLALAGIWPFAGFWSKDEILGDSWVAGLVNNELGGFIALAGLLLAAAFTAFYMWRQVELVFHGRPRTEAAAHAPESSLSMLIPLIVLAVFSVIGGFINLPGNAAIPTLGLDAVLGVHQFGSFLEHSVVNIHAADLQPLIAIVALGLAIGAILMARSIYGLNRGVTADRRDVLEANASFSRMWRLANARLYWDETYRRLFEQPFNRTSQFLADTLDWAFWHDYVHDTIIAKGFRAIGTLLSQPVDLGLIDGVVNGIGRLMRWASGGLREIQTGYVRTYAVSVLLGVVVVLIILLLPYIQRALASGN